MLREHLNWFSNTYPPPHPLTYSVGKFASSENPNSVGRHRLGLDKLMWRTIDFWDFFLKAVNWIPQPKKSFPLLQFHIRTAMYTGLYMPLIAFMKFGKLLVHTILRYYILVYSKNTKQLKYYLIKYLFLHNIFRTFQYLITTQLDNLLLSVMIT